MAGRKASVYNAGPAVFVQDFDFGDFDMPIYEYRCDDCGEEMEKLQRIGDDRLVDCPACEEPGLKRLVSAAAFRLKGSGWYETDFKKDNKRNLADSSATKNGSAGKSTDSASKKSEKPATNGADKKPAAKSVASSGAA